MRLIAALLTLLLVTPAIAQIGQPKTAVQLNAEVNANLASGQSPAITAVQLRQVLLDMIASEIGPNSGTTAAPNTLLAGPASGTASATPTFRSLVAEDLGSVTALANTVLAGPVSGGAGSVTFRALISADIPGGGGGTGTGLGYIDVKSTHGAKGDTLDAWDGTMTSGSAAFHSDAVTFTFADVGKQMVVDGAGTSGAPLITTIAAFVGPHDVTLASTAAVSVPYGYLSAIKTNVGSDATVTSSYASGDTVTLSGGSPTTTGVAVISATSVASVTLVSGGSGGLLADGTTTSGACQVIGTTGTTLGRKFILNVTLANGSITTIGTLSRKGTYTANPTNLANEPVSALNTSCSGLSGAVVSVVMKGEIVRPQVPGVYPGSTATLPATFTQASTSGTGAGQTFGAVYTQQGLFHYGTDDTAAWTAAVNAEITANYAGISTCIYVSPGNYFLRAPMPLFKETNGCVVGAGVKKSFLYISPAMSGDLFSWSEAWTGVDRAGLRFSSQFGGQSYRIGAGQSNGPIFQEISIMGDRSAPSNQNALVFYDRNDNIDVRHVEVWYLNGSALLSGVALNTAQGYIRESQFHDIRVQGAGNATHAAVDFDSAAGDVSNQVMVSQLNIYAANGIGLWLHNTVGNFRQFEFTQLRIEGQEFGGPNSPTGGIGGQGALLQLGNDNRSSSGEISNIIIKQAEFITPYPAQSAIRLVRGLNTVTGTDIHNNSIEGIIAGGFPYGDGLHIVNGRGNTFHFTSMFTLDYNIAFESTAGSINYVHGDNKSEQNWTYRPASEGFNVQQIASPGTILGGDPSGQASWITAFQAEGATGSATFHGGPRVSGTVDLNLTKHTSEDIPKAGRSALIAGQYNQIGSLGTYSAIVGGLQNRLTGPNSGVIGGSKCSDRGRQGVQCWSNLSIHPDIFYGSSQATRQVLSGTTSGTTAVRLTTDGAVASATNTVNMPNNFENALYTFSVRLSAVQRSISDQDLAASAAVAAGGNVLTFASVPSTVVERMLVSDVTSGHTGAIPATTFVTAVGATTVTLSNNVASTGVFTGDTIRFSIIGTNSTNAGTVLGNDTLHFATTPAYVVPGMMAIDTTSAGAITSGQYVLSVTSTTVVLSAGVDGAVGGADGMVFIPAMYSYVLPNAALVAGPSVTSTQFFGGTPLEIKKGSAATATIAVSADTVLGALNITFTPPAGNTSTWDVSATVDVHETQ